MRRAWWIAQAAGALALAAAAQAAIACGHCVEDKIAAVYDHGVVSAALAKKHHVAFFAVEGRLTGSAAERRVMEQAAEAAYGIDRGTMRASAEAAAISMAFDPARVSYAALERSLARRMMRRGLTLLPLKVMDKPAELKTAASR